MTWGHDRVSPPEDGHIAIPPPYYICCVNQVWASILLDLWGQF
jgi:hypothetical protein